MYRNVFSFQGIKLGSQISKQDDIFKALEEGRGKAKEIAGLLSIQIPGVAAGQIEIHCRSYDPQLWLFESLQPRPQTMAIVPGQKTLTQLAKEA